MGCRFKDTLILKLGMAWPRIHECFLDIRWIQNIYRNQDRKTFQSFLGLENWVITFFEGKVYHEFTNFFV
ncbi:hypothetical protein AEQU2_02777 [Aequorivita lipolytica]|nr:hypothetical protein AEQU2_02777 [Aequorivita lipolytica]